MSLPARVAVVTADDRFVRWTDRQEVHAKQLYHRSTHVMLFDHKGRLVLQRRHAQKLTYAGHWDISSSGHVEEGDYADPARPDDDLPALYAGVAARELEEELGVRVPLEPLGHFGPIAGVHYEQIELYRGVSDGPYPFQEEEISEICALGAADLRIRMAAGQDRFTDSLRWFVNWAIANGIWG